jgi:hypothetical protein
MKADETQTKTFNMKLYVGVRFFEGVDNMYNMRKKEKNIL